MQKMDAGQQAINSWVGATSDAIRALQGFRIALEHWQSGTIDDDEFVNEYRALDRAGLSQWADGLSDPSIDTLHDLLVTGEIDESRQGGDLIDQVTAIFG